MITLSIQNLSKPIQLQVKQADKPKLKIGRASNNEIVLDDGSVSQHHADIIIKNNKIYILDAKSTNGVLIHDHRIPPLSEIPVANGDPIIIGKFLIQISDAGADGEQNRRPLSETETRIGKSQSPDMASADMEQVNRYRDPNYVNLTFAVIPYEDFLKLIFKDGDDTIPHELVGLVIKKGMNLARAWRTHLGLTQKEVAKRAGISQAALSQMEKSANELRTATIEKLALAMGLSTDQLRD